MNILERIGEKLIEKNKSARERPCMSDLVLLLGKKEVKVAESLFYLPNYPRGYTPVIDENFGKGVKTVEGQKFLFEMLIVPVDLESYLDIVKKYEA